MELKLNKQLIRIKALGNTIMRRYKWKYDTHLYRSDMVAKELGTIEKKHIVILAPHSDDEWVGCSQLLITPNNEVTIINMDMPGGDDLSLHKKRYLEMKNVACKYNNRLVDILGDKKIFLKNYLKENNVDIVFVPSFFDWHSEHVSVMEIFNAAANEAGYDNFVAMYQVSIPIPSSFITHCSVMTKSELIEKWNKLYQYYPTQKKLPIKRFLANERINGAITHNYAIEAYGLMRFEKWSLELKKYTMNDREREIFYLSIQDIAKIRKMLKDLVAERR